MNIALFINQDCVSRALTDIASPKALSSLFRTTDF
jgi:hypothetical protein